MRLNYSSESLVIQKNIMLWMSLLLIYEAIKAMWLRVIQSKPDWVKPESLVININMTLKKAVAFTWFDFVNSIL
jgi:hypothetical protein